MFEYRSEELLADAEDQFGQNLAMVRIAFSTSDYRRMMLAQITAFRPIGVFI